MKKFIKSFFILLLVYSVTFASSFESNYRKGIYYFYNLQFDKANEYFLNALKIQPADPRPLHQISQIHLWTFLGTKDTAAYGKFIRLSGKVLELMETTDFFEEKEYLKDYWLGNAYAARAIAFSVKGEMMSAFWATKKAVGFYEDALDYKNDFYDAYLGIGIFEYALDFIPSVFKWALDLTGLEADKKQGFLKIKKAYENGNEAKTEATFHLGKLYLEFLAEYESSSELFLKLLQTYPRNSLFLFHLALARFNKADFDNTRKTLNEIINLNNQYFLQTNSFAYFLLGDIDFKENRFEQAVKNYQKFIEKAVSVDYTGIANLRIALAYKFLKNDNEYKRYLQLAGYGNLDIPEDNYAKDFSEMLFDIDLTQNELKIIKAQNLVFTKKYKEAVDLILPIINKIKINDWKGKAFTTLTEALMNLKKYNEAFNYASMAISLDYDFEKWLLPYSLYLKAMLYYEKGDFQEAKNYLTKAENENNYYMKNKILAKINNLKIKLGVF